MYKYCTTSVHANTVTYCIKIRMTLNTQRHRSQWSPNTEQLGDIK